MAPEIDCAAALSACGAVQHPAGRHHGVLVAAGRAHMSRWPGRRLFAYADYSTDFYLELRGARNGSNPAACRHAARADGLCACARAGAWPTGPPPLPSPSASCSRSRSPSPPPSAPSTRRSHTTHPTRRGRHFRRCCCPCRHRRLPCRRRPWRSPRRSSRRRLHRPVRRCRHRLWVAAGDERGPMRPGRCREQRWWQCGSGAALVGHSVAVRAPTEALQRPRLAAIAPVQCARRAYIEPSHIWSRRVCVVKRARREETNFL